jgi:bud site selection protein 20
MGARGAPKSKSKSKRRFYKRMHLDLKNRTKDTDQIQDDMKRIAEGVAVVEKSDDLPGSGENYCIECARHFISKEMLTHHQLSKQHKRQVKRVHEEQYTQAEADAGAGMSR